MKSFFKYVLATITGIIILNIIAFSIFFVVIGSFTKKDTPTTPEKAILQLNLNYLISDHKPEEDLLFMSAITPDYGNPMGLRQIVENIEKAKADENIKGIYLHLSFMGAGFGKVEEIRNALLDFKESGKFIYAYSEYYYNSTYYLASVADKVFINPKGSFMFNGLMAEVMFFKDFLDKAGVEMQVVRHGKFKGAVEPFIRNEMSAENRLQTEVYVHSIYNQMLSEISQSRKVSEDSIRNIVNQLMIRDPQDAVKLGLVDATLYKDEVLQELKKALDIKEDQEIELVKNRKYLKIRGKLRKGDDIAILFASGDIVSGEGQSGEIGSETFIKAIRKIREDDDIKAVVVRIDSRGGSALASDVIWRELMLTKKKKPVIASMGDIAASGGYYIAVPADTIVCQPNTITGSIGVFGLIPNGQKVMNEKLGLHFDRVKTGEYADLGSIDRPLSDDERAIIQSYIETIYSDFIEKVAEGRGMNVADVDSIGQGRVWSGSSALKIGLVDVEGGLNKALAIAAHKAGMKNYKIVTYPKKSNELEQLLKTFSISAQVDKTLEEKGGDLYLQLKHLENITAPDRIQMALPYGVQLK